MIDKSIFSIECKTRHPVIFESYIFDPFNAGLSRYTVESVIVEKPDVEYNDGVTKIFLNADGKTHDDVTDEMREFLDYVGGRGQTGNLAGKVEKAMETTKKMENWRIEYMQMRERETEARAEGIEQGILQGAQKRNHEIASAMKEKGIALEEISDITGLSLDVIATL